MSESYFFHTEQLTVGYDGKPLIKDIQIRLNKGQILTLIGPNGSGKTTILKSITKHLKSLFGTVYIDGCALDDMTNRDLSYRLAVVLTERLKTELMTCEDVVGTGRYPYTGRLGILSQKDHQLVREAMELVDVWDLRNRDYTQLSDGQRQRVMLARAICQEPQIIVLDEPTSFLDIRYQLELLNILQMLAKKRSIAVILSLHELDLAQKISDIIVCVKGEQIAHYGTPQEIFRRELIESLYDLTNGSYNPMFGSVEMARPQGKPRIFVIGGGGAGIETYRALQQKDTPFICGILHENDLDYPVANVLASEVIVEKPFSQIRQETYQRALDALASCDMVINCLEQYGEMNEKNRELLQAANDLGIRIISSANEL